MDENKRLFKQIITTTILRKHRNKMSDLKHFHRKRRVGLEKTPIEEYGIKWGGGTIMLRRYTDENNVEVFGNIGGHFDSLEINYFDINGADFVNQYKQAIKEMIQGIEVAYHPNNQV
jgi:hypothetical protein